MQYVNHATAVIYRDCRMWEDKLSVMQKELNLKITKDVVKKKVMKAKNIFQAEMENIRRRNEAMINDTNKRIMNEVGGLEHTVKENEKNTLWKISDCNLLIQKRASHEYIDNAINSLNEQLLREVKGEREKEKESEKIHCYCLLCNVSKQTQIYKTNEENFKDIRSTLIEHEDKTKMLEEELQEKQKNIKILIHEIEEDLRKQFCMSDTYETNRKIVADKISDMEHKLVLLDRRGSAVDAENRLNKLI